MSSVGPNPNGVGGHSPTNQNPPASRTSETSTVSAVAGLPIGIVADTIAKASSEALKPLGESYTVALGSPIGSAGRSSTVAQSVLAGAAKPTSGAVLIQASSSKKPEFTEKLLAHIRAIPAVAPRSAAMEPNRATAIRKMAEWTTAIRANNPDSIQSMNDIITEFSENPQLLQSLTIADGKPLDLQTLKDQLSVKSIDLILQEKVPNKTKTDAIALVSQIKNPARKAQALEIINASPQVREALRSSPQVIRNPANNCFMDAALVSLLGNPTNYSYIHDAMGDIIGSANSGKNPTIDGADTDLVRECGSHPLDSDYTRWQIRDNGQKITTFLRMTLGDAAKCAKALIEKWHAGEELNTDESTLLRLALSKLSNIGYVVSNEGEFPHINDGTLTSILPGNQEDSQQFTSALLNGLNELAPDKAQSNPFRILDGLRSAYERRTDLHPIETRLYPREEVDTSMGPDIDAIRAACPNPGAEGRKPVLNMLYSNPEGNKGTNFTLLRSLMEDEKGYQLDSIVLRMSSGGTYSGHYVTLKQVQVEGRGVWLRYDDLSTPHVKALSADQVEKILRGEVTGQAPLSFVFSEAPQRPISGELISALASVAPEAPDRPAQPFTHPDFELKQRCKELISQGQLDMAIKVATRVQNPVERFTMHQDIQRTADSAPVTGESATAELPPLKRLVQTEIENARGQFSTPQKIWVAFVKLFSCFSTSQPKAPTLKGRVTTTTRTGIREPLLQETVTPPTTTGKATGVATAILAQPAARPSDAQLEGKVNSLIDQHNLRDAFTTAKSIQDPSQKLRVLERLITVTAADFFIGAGLSTEMQASEFKASVQTEIAPLKKAPAPPSDSPSTISEESTSDSGRSSSRSEELSRGAPPLTYWNFDVLDRGSSIEPSPIALIKSKIEDTSFVTGGTINAIGILETYVNQGKFKNPQEINEACLLVGMAECNTIEDESQPSIARRALALMGDGPEKRTLVAKMTEKGWSLTPIAQTPPLASGPSGGVSSAPPQRRRAGMMPQSIPSAQTSPGPIEDLREPTQALTKLDAAYREIMKMPESDQKNERIFWIGVVGLVKKARGETDGELVTNLLAAAETNKNASLQTQFIELQVMDKDALFKELGEIHDWTDPDPIVKSLMLQIKEGIQPKK
ncbi:MAG: hypothetical protein NTX49_07800 [Chlamydiae bacterium]|nr:hypothetical protein [Chlamydiota bacterium]